MPAGRFAVDLVGRTFSRWTVTARAPNRPTKEGAAAFWRCVCACGTVAEVSGSSLKKGGSQSCGCLAREKSSVRNRRHGLHGTTEYKLWRGLMDRCTNPNGKHFADYMGRGITVCHRWRYSFEAFFSDVGRRPADDLEIDRIDNDGGYWCGKCDECIQLGRAPNWRWATSRQQARNRRSNRLITANGVTACASEWSERTGIKKSTILMRLESGWSESDAVTKPTHSTRSASMRAVRLREREQRSATEKG